MPIDIVTLANSGQPINNGSIITFNNDFDTKKLAPYINSYVDQTKLFNKMDSRYVNFYGGVPTGYIQLYKYPKLLQSFLDKNPYYSSSTLNSYPILTAEESGTLATPRAGRCFLFDGTDDFAQVPLSTALQSLSAFTFSCWFKTSAAQGAVFSAGSGLDFIRDILIGLSGSAVIVEVNNSVNGSATLSVSDYTSGTWACLSVVFDGTQTGNENRLKIYINGAQKTVSFSDGYSVPSSTSSTMGTDIRIGSYSPSPPQWYWNGSLRDIRIYNVAKSAAEIAAIYNQASTPRVVDRTGLLAAWWCEEESGTTAYDWSGNGKHLTLNNITQSTFHAADTGVTYSAANDLGHSKATVALFTNNNVWNSAWLSQESFSGDGYVDFLFQGQLTLLGVTTDTSFSGTAVFNDLDFGVQSSGGATLSFYQSGVGQQSGTAVSGDILRFVRNGTTITVLKNGTLIYTFTNASTGTLRACIQSYNSPAAICLSVNGKSPGTFYTTSGTTYSDLILPRKESDNTVDVLGNSLHYSGPLKLPATVEVPCITGDGSAVYADLGTTSFTEDFEVSCWTMFTQTPGGEFVFSGGNSGGGIEVYLNNASQGAVYIDGLIAFSFNLGRSYLNEWFKLSLVRVGSTITVKVNDVTKGTGTSLSGTYKVSTLFRRVGGGFSYYGRIADYRITTGGVTKRFPLQEGPGTDNTNRNLYWVASDGTNGTVSGAIVGGTVSTIWANRCPYAQDHCVNYGGRLTPANTFVAGRLTGSLAADGLAKTLTAGKHGNPNSRIVPNVWNAPSLTKIGYTSSVKLAPTNAVQSISPVDTKFRRTSSSGDDRYFASYEAFTGDFKTKAQAYTK